ncbi:TrbC/VirB2 family protein [Pleomorphomonas koreensis]|uniref:TrbC/VirB2 family protein n=1 Tax=Pleomorphomonas koreensis TaxID=257440 RepID=UPI0003FFAB36|nr:TrbC/VirB2 family protein [Pleomorphomonas koreensis]
MSRKTLFARIVLAFAVGATLSFPAFASSGGSLPWEGPLQQIQQSITGPVAGFIALAAVAVAGGMLIFGGELNDFARRLMYVVLVAGILLGATQIVALFGATGASIGTAGGESMPGSTGQGAGADG